MERKRRIGLAYEIVKLLILLVKLIRDFMVLVGGATNYHRARHIQHQVRSSKRAGGFRSVCFRASRRGRSTQVRLNGMAQA
jgi:hypothetical protein